MAGHDGYQNNMMFSTYDRDNDRHEVNCDRSEAHHN